MGITGVDARELRQLGVATRAVRRVRAGRRPEHREDVRVIKWLTGGGCKCGQRRGERITLRGWHFAQDSFDCATAVLGHLVHQSPGPPVPHRRDHTRVDQVRNGNRWRVVALDPGCGGVAAERLSDSARVTFDNNYVKSHITLGYAATVHSAQGVTTDSCYAILGEGASRAMLYVAMTRGRHNNEAFLYQRFTNEADHEHSKPLSSDGVHIARRGNKYSAAHHFRMILAKDDRPRTMHAEAERTKRHLLPEISLRSASAPRRAPSRSPSSLDGGPPGRGAVACHARTAGRNGSSSGREHSSRCLRTGDVNCRLFHCTHYTGLEEVCSNFQRIHRRLEIIEQLSAIERAAQLADRDVIAPDDQNVGRARTASR